MPPKQLPSIEPDPRSIKLSTACTPGFQRGIFLSPAYEASPTYQGVTAPLPMETQILLYPTDGKVVFVGLLPLIQLWTLSLGVCGEGASPIYYTQNISQPQFALSKVVGPVILDPAMRFSPMKVVSQSLLRWRDQLGEDDLALIPYFQGYGNGSSLLTCHTSI